MEDFAINDHSTYVRRPRFLFRRYDSASGSSDSSRRSSLASSFTTARQCSPRRHINQSNIRTSSPIGNVLWSSVNEKRGLKGVTPLQSPESNEEECAFCSSMVNERQYYLWESEYTRSSMCSRCSDDNAGMPYISYWGTPKYEFGSWRKRYRDGRGSEIDLTPLIEVLHRIDAIDTSICGKRSSQCLVCSSKSQTGRQGCEDEGVAHGSDKLSERRRRRLENRQYVENSSEQTNFSRNNSSSNGYTTDETSKTGSSTNETSNQESSGQFYVKTHGGKSVYSHVENFDTVAKLNLIKPIKVVKIESKIIPQQPTSKNTSEIHSSVNKVTNDVRDSIFRRILNTPNAESIIQYRRNRRSSNYREFLAGLEPDVSLKRRSTAESDLPKYSENGITDITPAGSAENSESDEQNKHKAGPDFSDENTKESEIHTESQSFNQKENLIDLAQTFTNKAKKDNKTNSCDILGNETTETEALATDSPKFNRKRRASRARRTSVIRLVSKQHSESEDSDEENKTFAAIRLKFENGLGRNGRAHSPVSVLNADSSSSTKQPCSIPLKAKENHVDINSNNFSSHKTPVGNTDSRFKKQSTAENDTKKENCHTSLLNQKVNVNSNESTKHKTGLHQQQIASLSKYYNDTINLKQYQVLTYKRKDKPIDQTLKYKNQLNTNNKTDEYNNNTSVDENIDSDTISPAEDKLNRKRRNRIRRTSKVLINPIKNTKSEDSDEENKRLVDRKKSEDLLQKSDQATYLHTESNSCNSVDGDSSSSDTNKQMVKTQPDKSRCQNELIMTNDMKIIDQAKSNLNEINDGKPSSAGGSEKSSDGSLEEIKAQPTGANIEKNNKIYTSRTDSSETNTEDDSKKSCDDDADTSDTDGNYDGYNTDKTESKNDEVQNTKYNNERRKRLPQNKVLSLTGNLHNRKQCYGLSENETDNTDNETNQYFEHRDSISVRKFDKRTVNNLRHITSAGGKFLRLKQSEKTPESEEHEEVDPDIERIKEKLRRKSKEYEEETEKVDEIIDLNGSDDEEVELGWRTRGYNADFYMSRKSVTGSEILDRYRKAISSRRSRNTARAESRRNMRVNGKSSVFADLITESQETDNECTSVPSTRPGTRRHPKDSNVYDHEHSPSNNKGVNALELIAALDRAASCTERLDKRLNTQIYQSHFDDDNYE